MLVRFAHSGTKWNENFELYLIILFGSKYVHKTRSISLQIFLFSKTLRIFLLLLFFFFWKRALNFLLLKLLNMHRTGTWGLLAYIRLYLKKLHFFYKNLNKEGFFTAELNCNKACDLRSYGSDPDLVEWDKPTCLSKMYCWDDSAGCELNCFKGRKSFKWANCVAFKVRSSENVHDICCL